MGDGKFQSTRCLTSDNVSMADMLTIWAPPPVVLVRHYQRHRIRDPVLFVRGDGLLSKHRI